MKRCSAFGIGGGPQAAVVRFNDGAANAKSHAGAVSLRGKERIENLVRLLCGQPYAGVANGQQKLLVLTLVVI